MEEREGHSGFMGLLWFIVFLWLLVVIQKISVLLGFEVFERKVLSNVLSKEDSRI